MTASPEPRPDLLDQHLSQLTTTWTALFQAHADGGAAPAAQQVLLQRYGGAVYRYLLASVRDRDAADELFQEFALRLVRGDFRRADPGKGRFRDFLKTCLFHLVVDFQRRQKRGPVPLPPDAPEPADDAAPSAASDQEFQTIWLAELMNRAWAALAEAERREGRPLHAVLRFRTDHPELRSAEMAAQLSARLGRAVTAGWVRKQLMSARERFTDLLVEEAAQSLGTPTADELGQELADLGILDYCRDALGRRAGRT
jgi:RNA polymerase sigma-70 factor (ECF subfamily)